jgi:hypothetical protein
LTVSLAVTAPFKTSDDGAGVSLGVATTVKNVGRSVAQNVGVTIAIYPQAFSPEIFTEPLKRQGSLCAGTPSASGFLKMTLFPMMKGRWDRVLIFRVRKSLAWQ